MDNTNFQKDFFVFPNLFESVWGNDSSNLNDVEVKKFKDYLNSFLAELDKKSFEKTELKYFIKVETELTNYYTELEDTFEKTSNKIISELIQNVSSGLDIAETKKNKRIKYIFGRRLQSLLVQRKKTSKDLEKLLRVSQQTVSSYIAGSVYPSPDKVNKICTFLDCSVDYLLNEDIRELNYQDDKVYKDIGLDANSINILRWLRSNRLPDFCGISFTLNALIHRLYFKGDLRTDVLTAITEYIKETRGKVELYTVTEENLEMLKDHLREIKSLDEIHAVFNNFKEVLAAEDINRMNRFTDPQILHLKNIENKLRNTWEELRTEYLEYVDKINKS